MKKLNKFFAVLVALAMMATLCVSMAFAVDEQEGSDKTPGEGQSSAAAVMSKTLTIADGVAVPDATFTFDFTPKASDTDTQTAARTATLSTTGTGAMTATAATNDGNSVAGSFNIADVFKDNGALIFTGPGEYIYEVTERDQTTNPVVTTDETTGKVTTETYTNSNADYIVRVYVKYNERNALYIDTITITDKATGNKVSVTDGAVFENNYDKKAEVPQPTKETALLEVTKTVEAPAGMVASNQTYPFSINLAYPENYESDDTSVQAYKISGTTRTPVTINLGGDTFELAAGETLAFGALPYGSTYTITETLADGTVPSFTSYMASATGSDTITNPTSKGTNVVAAGLVDDAAQDTFDVTNKIDADDVTPTGILMNNLPYIALALVAIGGLVAYVVVRRRNADEA